MTVHDNIDRNEETLTGKFKLNSTLKKNLISQKCNLIATRLCYFPCNGIEEISSYRYIVLKFCLTDYQKQLMNFVKRLLNYS